MVYYIKYIFKIFIFLCSIFIILSCDKNIEKKIQKENDNQVSSSKKDSTLKNFTNNYSGPIKIKAGIESKILEKSLPKSVKNGYKLNTFYGINIENGYKIGYVSSDYKFSGSGGLTIKIFDYRDLTLIPKDNSQNIFNPVNEPGMTLTQISKPNIVGFTKWDYVTKNGKIQLLVCKRFMINIEFYHLSTYYKGPDDMISLINTDELLKLND